MGWDYLGCPQPSHQDPNCSSHPDDPSGWDGITWDVPNHPTQIPTVHPIPMTHRDGMGIPGMSPTIHPDPNCSSHPDDNPPLKAIMFLIGFICYDDACHLKRFARDPMRAGITDQGKQLASVEMVVDKMHMRRSRRSMV